MTQKKSRLGTGLGTILSGRGLDKILPKSGPGTYPEEQGQPLMVETGRLDLNPDQPRRHFNEKELASLGQSIKAKGIIEPLVVSAKDDGRYELIAGERRLRAAKLVNLDQVPVIIRKNTEDASDRLVLALLENLCRADLNSIEEAESFARLEKDFGKTHQEIALLTGRERPSITNSVRLLKLPESIQDDIRFQRLSAGHGKSMLGLNDPSLYPALRAEILTKNLTVRQTDALVRRFNKAKTGAGDPPVQDEAYYSDLEQKFTHQLQGLKVKINYAGQVKKVEIFYRGPDDLEYLMKKIGLEL